MTRVPAIEGSCALLIHYLLVNRTREDIVRTRLLSNDPVGPDAQVR